MNRFIFGAIALICTPVIAAAQQWGGGAYPSNWNGGPPLPTIGQAYQQYAPPQYAQPYVTYGQPQYAQPQYAQPQYAQPQYAQPQYAQPQYAQPQYAQPQYAQPQYAQPQYSTRGYGFQQQIPAVQGPADARCIVATLNGVGRQSGCANVRINPADYPYLRQKFSAYRLNSGYVLNLPSDSEFQERP